MSKTADYTKKAISDYQKRKERFTVLFESGTKERIYQKYGGKINLSAYVKRLIENDLNNTTDNIVKNETPDNSDSFPWDVPE